MPKHETFLPPKSYAKKSTKLLSILRKSTVSTAPAPFSVSVINLGGSALENRTDSVVTSANLPQLIEKQRVDKGERENVCKQGGGGCELDRRQGSSKGGGRGERAFGFYEPGPRFFYPLLFVPCSFFLPFKAERKRGANEVVFFCAPPDFVPANFSDGVHPAGQDSQSREIIARDILSRTKIFVFS